MGTFIFYAREFINYLVLVGAILAVVLLIALIHLKVKKRDNWLTDLIKGRAMLWVFIVSLTATLGSLFFSEIAGYEPCKLCWYQRILMYPLALLSGIALIRKENWLLPYALVMSVIGGLVALYHYFLQIGTLLNLAVDKFAPCSTVGYSASCTSIFQLKFGFITIPMMAFIAFSIITIILLIKSDKRN